MECEEGREIFVGDINNETTEESLLQYFSRYGDVLSTFIVKDRATGRPRGYGFVVFSEVSSARDALKDSNHILHGKKVIVNKSRRKDQQQQMQCHCYFQSQCCQCRLNADQLTSTNHPSNRKIFVGGLPKGLTEEEFQNFFSRFGEIIESKIIFDRETGLQKGFGFVTFQSDESVLNVMQNTRYELCHKSVEVKRAIPKYLMDANSCYCHQNGGSRTGPYNLYWPALNVNYVHNFWIFAIYGQHPMFNKSGQLHYAVPLWFPYTQWESPYTWPRAGYTYGASTGVHSDYFGGVSPITSSRMFYTSAYGFPQDVSRRQETRLRIASNLKDEVGIRSIAPQSQQVDIAGLNDTRIAGQDDTMISVSHGVFVRR